MQGRLKSIYSIYKKMIRKKIPVRQVYDARALRIIVDDEGASRTGDAWAAAYRWAALHSNHAYKSVLLSIRSICKMSVAKQTFGMCIWFNSHMLTFVRKREVAML